MNVQGLVLCLCGFALLGSLPLVFFRRGRLTRGWWLTAAPFPADAALLIAALAGLLEPAAIPAPYMAALGIAAVPLAAAAIGIIGCTAGVHRVPLALWHQEDDAAAALVTFGPYAVLRHPFYAAFILLLLAAAVALPHPATLVLLGAGTLQLHRTAVREERRLLSSPHGASYAAYMRSTGRFLPRLIHAPASSSTRAPGCVTVTEPRSSKD